MTEQQAMLHYQDLDFNDGYDYSYANGDDYFTSGGGLLSGFNNLIGGFGSLYTNYQNQQYQSELNDIRLERLRNGFDNPQSTSSGGNNTALYVAGGIGTVVLLIGFLK